MTTAAIISSSKETLPDELTDYLESLADSGDITISTMSRASRIWTQLRAESTPTLPCPDASYGDDGEVLLTWDNTEHHFEIELLPNGTAEWFYRNRASSDLAGGEYPIGNVIPEAAMQKLAFFL